MDCDTTAIEPDFRVQAQEIVALRTDNSESDVIMVDGVGNEHKPTDVLAVSG